MVEAYVNRGYVLNDLQNSEQAADDFTHALKLAPNNGVAHLGLAFSYLELHRPKLALEQAETAQKLMGESGSTHLALAGAYRQQQLFGRATDEYLAALRSSPNDQTLHLALADVYFHQHRYSEAISEYRSALLSSPDDPHLYAQMANTYAHLRDSRNTYRYVAAAEEPGNDDSQVLLQTGNALLSLGDRDAAMQRFQRALEAPDADRVSVRLSLAELLVKEGHYDDARQQISVAFAESRIGEAAPITGDQMVQAASLVLGTHDFETARRLYNAAANSGADQRVVAVGLANTYLAEGNTRSAEAELKSLGNPAEIEQNYDYQMAMSNVYRQQGNSTMALSALGRASALTPEADETLQRSQMDLAAEAGLPINRKFSVVSDSSFAPIFEDETIYQLDARLFGVKSSGQLPTPRYSYESRSTAYYTARLSGLPLISGYAEERNARGDISFPSVSQIIHRDTYDTSINSALNPVLHVGAAKLQFSTGLQFTARRDKESAFDLNENLFRQFVYVNTNSLFNLLQINADAIHEAGPFTLQSLSSKDTSAHVQFRVGRPWGNTALITGWGARDLQFHPLVREYFSTNTYGGLEHKFGLKWKVTGLAELIRSWRVQDTNYAIAQAVRPSGQVQYRPNTRWSFDGSFGMSRGFGDHNYDNFETGFLLSYVKPWHGRQAAMPDSTVDYPMRFSVGVRTQSFYDFGAGTHNTIVPVFRITLF
jgi:tetratricopeptide (TPR) repeat protein